MVGVYIDEAVVFTGRNEEGEFAACLERFVGKTKHVERLMNQMHRRTCRSSEKVALHQVVD